MRIPLEVFDGGSCGCGESYCCGECVPAAVVDELRRQYETLEVIRCGSQCTCGGIPVLPDDLDAGLISKRSDQRTGPRDLPPD